MSNCSAFCVEKSSHNFTAIMLIFCRIRSLTTLFELFSKIVPKQVKTFVAMLAFDKGNLVVWYLQTHLVHYRGITLVQTTFTNEKDRHVEFSNFYAFTIAITRQTKETHIWLHIGENYIKLPLLSIAQHSQLTKWKPGARDYFRTRWFRIIQRSFFRRTLRLSSWHINKRI